MTSPATEAPPCARVATAEKLTCSAPTITARRPTLRPWRWTSCCSVEVVITPAGREPGTSRAERGRSRQPVARITAGGSISSLPPGPVSFSRRCSLPVGDHRLGEDLDAPSDPRARDSAARTRAGEHGAQVAQSEARVVGVPRDPSGLALSLDHRHRARCRDRAARLPPQGPTGRRPRSTGPSAIAIDVPPSTPMRPQHRRRSPGSAPSAHGSGGAGRPGPTGGIGLASAASISPRVTRSQKQTIRPQSGSRSIRSPSW